MMKARTQTVKPIAIALRELMDERGYTTDTALWAAADISSSTLSLYLSGRRGTRMNGQSVQTVKKIAAALEIEPTYFVEYRLWELSELLYEHLELVDSAAAVVKGHLLSSPRKKKQ